MRTIKKVYPICRSELLPDISLCQTQGLWLVLGVVFRTWKAGLLLWTKIGMVWPIQLCASLRGNMYENGTYMSAFGHCVYEILPLLVLIADKLEHSLKYWDQNLLDVSFRAYVLETMFPQIDTTTAFAPQLNTK